MALTWNRQLDAVPEAVPRLRHELVEFARVAGADRATCDDLALSVSEAAGNVVRHAYPGGAGGAIVVEASIDSGDGLLVRIADRGCGIAAGALSGSGYGLGLMTELTDQICVEDGEHGIGTAITLRFAIADGAAESRRASAAARR